ncbi:sialidase family protein [Coraliomargarita sp. SDUM461004]|uniref:Sialidase family protein n=1 Tax=Thalassobacterium sedimentorum TaxID=3041258 RepID=A0ABU1AL77_9BACT|nr:sialidase family protein [Coraliomargarita sp. SDUM461004]MDQ8194943.1 sialidase family protein [Coraliomargarita sp. SDUM461004]
MRVKLYIYKSLRLLVLLSFLGRGAPVLAAPDVEHIIVSYDKDEFAGWPANQGIWIWGDDILVGYNIGKYKYRDGKHSIDPEERMQVAFSRSQDGGHTWERESAYDAVGFRRSDLKASSDFDADSFLSPNFAMKFRYDSYHYSNDRGLTWEGPFELQRFEDPNLIARTNYIVTGGDSALVFLTSSPRAHSTKLGRGRSFMVETSDRGKTFEFISWIGPDLGEGLPDSELPAFSTMPSAVEIEDGHLVCTLRQRVNRRKWTDVYESTDHGRTWEHISLLEKGSTNPAVLVNLGGTRLAAIYGWRGRPFGLRAKLSRDGGHNWSDEIILRDDGISWDIGYPRAVVREDGTVVVVYYYSTKEMTEQHIAATLWRPHFD